MRSTTPALPPTPLPRPPRMRSTTPPLSPLSPQLPPTPLPRPPPMRSTPPPLPPQLRPKKPSPPYSRPGDDVTGAAPAGAATVAAIVGDADCSDDELHELVIFWSGCSATWFRLTHPTDV